MLYRSGSLNTGQPNLRPISTRVRLNSSSIARRREEAADRKNARIIDKIRLALPRELDEEQRAKLVVDFARDLTQNRTPWYAAIHQNGKDAHNPH